MPLPHLALMLAVVIFAAGVTVWLFTIGGPGVLVAALPAFLIAALALKVLRR
jgi:hypothetical protein